MRHVLVIQGLGLHPQIVYLSGRPYVLRDSTSPRDGVALTERTENLEAIERRLKADIVAEAAKCVPANLKRRRVDL